MKDLEMIRSLDEPISEISILIGYSIISINENNGYLWEEVMDSSWGNHIPGDFRYVMVANNGYEENRIFVLLNEKNQPVATASAWDYGMDYWDKEPLPEVSFIGVHKTYQGKELGKLMVTYALLELKKRGYKKSHLGIRNTGESDNFPAVKTYINCGFTPYIDDIDEEEHIEAWRKVYMHFNMSLPNFFYQKSILPQIKMPHPPRPWPYQVRCAAKAQELGDLYVFGTWVLHNMYLVDMERYIQLKPIIMQSAEGQTIISCIINGNINKIIIDSPYNPKAVLIEKLDGTTYSIGESDDKRFAEGVEKYLQYSANIHHHHINKLPENPLTKNPKML